MNYHSLSLCSASLDLTADEGYRCQQVQQHISFPAMHLHTSLCLLVLHYRLRSLIWPLALSGHSCQPPHCCGEQYNIKHAYTHTLQMNEGEYGSHCTLSADMPACWLTCTNVITSQLSTQSPHQAINGQLLVQKATDNRVEWTHSCVHCNHC